MFLPRFFITPLLSLSLIPSSTPISIQAPSFITPASGSTIRVKVNFTLAINLPEVATEDTVQLRIDPLDPLVDTNGARTIIFSRQLAGDYTVIMTNLSIAGGGGVDGIVSVTPAIDLIHLAQYIFKIQYQDELRNAPNFDFTGGLTFDTQTALPELDFPVSSTTFREAFVLDFTLPELALAATVSITFAPTGRIEGDGWKYHATSIDPSGNRIFSLGVTTAQRYQLQMQSFDTVASALSEITSLANPTPLVHLNSYDVSMTFRDSAGNLASTTIQSNCTFDTVTIAPTLLSPADNQYIAENFTAGFFLPEIAQSGTVTLTFTYVSSIKPRATPEDDNPRVVTFDGTIVAPLNTYTIIMCKFSKAAGEKVEIAR